ncbi:sensor histidine kinase [Clostridium hydrogeniformans]|uniref:sensor histidine kinase n=1 Tax=Clostridium hydrogeniformans TaxID=349933 RepID=UPI0005561378|nr:HAMP domain-containing sensor histidine kinase [Clostridium hydrogeniformans]
MLIVIIIFLTIITGIFATLYFFIREEIKSVKNQLNSINNIKTNSKVLLRTGRSEIEKLILEINKTIELKQEIESNYKKMDLEIKQSISNISHDLRTPLTSIMGYLQLMEDTNISESERKEYMNIVKERTKALQMLITSFYDLSRLEGKEYKFQFELINLSNLLCDSMASFYNDFINKGIEPSIDIEAEAPMILGDENGVKRVLFNLIQNILKHGNGPVEISLKKDGNNITTTFTNEAKDLSEEDSKLLFQRFFTTDRTRSGKSTGIGLAVTKELVNQMGHDIHSELKDGRLSIIIIWKIKDIENNSSSN